MKLFSKYCNLFWSGYLIVTDRRSDGRLSMASPCYEQHRKILIYWNCHVTLVTDISYDYKNLMKVRKLDTTIREWRPLLSAAAQAYKHVWAPIPLWEPLVSIREAKASKTESLLAFWHPVEATTFAELIMCVKMYLLYLIALHLRERGLHNSPKK